MNEFTHKWRQITERLREAIGPNEKVTVYLTTREVETCTAALCDVLKLLAPESEEYKRVKELIRFLAASMAIDRKKAAGVHLPDGI